MIAFGVSEKGKYRTENQDAILMRSDRRTGLFLVADGVGGSEHGAMVSGQIRDGYDAWWKEKSSGLDRYNFLELFDEAKRLAVRLNADVCSRYGTGKSASTLVLLLIHDTACGVLSVGDSRVYRCKKNDFRCITRDDTIKNLSGVHAGERDEEKLVSAVGGYRELEYSSQTDSCESGAVYLLCSDGIYRYAGPSVIRSNMRNASWNTAFGAGYLNQITNSAVENDTRDNYSAVMVKV